MAGILTQIPHRVEDFRKNREPWRLSMTLEKRASLTAVMVAALRAEASAWPDAICHDPWAAQLAGEEGLRYAERSKRSFPPMALWLAVRTAYIDAHVRHFIEHAGTQVVLLGAGLDTRAQRLAHPNVSFYEVDTPQSSQHKQTQLQRLDGYPLDAATYVTCNFEHQDPIERLQRAGFSTELPAFFVWEGVTYYLTEEAVRATVRSFAEQAHPQSLLLFDIFSKRFVRADTGQQGDRESVQMVEDMGEPFRWGTNDPLPLLFEEGLRYVDITRFDEACLALTGSYERERMFRFQSFVLCAKQVPSILPPLHSVQK